MRRLVRWLVPALAVAVVAGTVVTGTGPHGGDEDARRFGFEIETVARMHSLAVLVFLGLLLAVLHRLPARRRTADVAPRGPASSSVVAVAQAAVGWTQYFTGVPALLVGVHIARRHARAGWRCARLVLAVPAPGRASSARSPRYEQVPA